MSEETSRGGSKGSLAVRAAGVWLALNHTKLALDHTLPPLPPPAICRPCSASPCSPGRRPLEAKVAAQMVRDPADWTVSGVFGVGECQEE